MRDKSKRGEKMEETSVSIFQDTKSCRMKEVWRHCVSSQPYTDLTSPSIRDLQKNVVACRPRLSVWVPKRLRHPLRYRDRETEFYIYSPAMHRYTIYDIYSAVKSICPFPVCYVFFVYLIRFTNR